MCGRFTQQRPASELSELFEAELLVEDPGARYNVAPTQDALVVVERDGERRLTSFRWGLVPAWADGLDIGSRHINARAETIRRSSAFAESFRRRRCLVPVDGFYEWRTEGRRRQPYLVRRRDGGPLVLAGLWASWRPRDGSHVVRSFAIVTTAPNDLIATLHDRMPVLLAPTSWRRWLDTRAGDAQGLEELLEPSVSDELELVAVSTLVNDVRNEGPELLSPPAAEQLTVPVESR
ncbi:MAG TPA: SOS response-associated peptidase [Candidatus Limnocylindrales bacterium]